jgi:hypothetical protein
MDFIERIFHIAPDGGTGAMELAIVLLPVIITLAAAMLRKRRLTG